MDRGDELAGVASAPPSAKAHGLGARIAQSGAALAAFEGPTFGPKSVPRRGKPS
jgi:hypothetical protein